MTNIESIKANAIEIASAYIAACKTGNKEYAKEIEKVLETLNEMVKNQK